MEEIIERASTQVRLVECSERGLEAWQHTFLAQAQEPDPNRQQMPEHSRNYDQGLRAWLGRVYLQMDALVGDVYKRLVDQYLIQNPLTAVNQGNFEYDFLDVVRDCMPEYYDLAYCDWCMHTSYSAADHVEFPYAQFAALQSEAQMRVYFQTAPSLMTLNSNVPLDAIWSLYKAGDVKQALLALQSKQKDDRGFLVARLEFQPVILAMTDCESQFIEALRKKICLADLPEDVHFLIPKWIQAGYIVDFSDTA